MTQPTVARVDVPFHGGTIQLTVFGAERAAPPLLCVPGGPGLPHDYLTPLTALATERPVVLYDPIGTGRSTRLPLSWSRALLAEELHVIRSHLGSAPVDLYLHSAAILGADDLWVHPHRYRRVIFASTPFDIPAYTAAIEACIDQLEPRLAAALRAGEADPAKCMTLYSQAYYQFSRRHLLRLPETPAAMQKATLGFNRAILRAVKGGMLLHSGECTTWSCVDRLPALAPPVLITWGRHDPYAPELVASSTAGIPDRRLVVFERSSHLPHLEEPAAHCEAVRAFLAE